MKFAAMRQQQEDEYVDSPSRCQLPISSFSEECESCAEFEYKLTQEFEYLFSEASKRSVIKR